MKNLDKAFLSAAVALFITWCVIGLVYYAAQGGSLGRALSITCLVLFATAGICLAIGTGLSLYKEVTADPKPTARQPRPNETEEIF